MSVMTGRPAVLRVASFNVCGLPSALPPLTQRAAEFCRRFEESDLDVLNLQEVWGRGALATIRAGLPSFPFVACRRGLAGLPGGGLVTLSRRPLTAVSYTPFRGARPDRGSLRFRVKRAVNSRLQGVLTAELAGLGVVVANTHLTANKDGDWSAGNRYFSFQRQQVGMLHAALRRAGAAGPTSTGAAGPTTAGTALMIVTGDFNIASDGPLYPLIVDGGAWRDPFAATDPVTFHVEFLPPGCAAHRIDYVLIHGDPARFAVLDSGPMFTEPVALPDGRRMYLSDHVALTAGVALDSVSASGRPDRAG
jgi:endonuclease/exonuclease/phosphatase family metal-dependent hydrolase